MSTQLESAFTDAVMMMLEWYQKETDGKAQVQRTEETSFTWKYGEHTFRVDIFDVTAIHNSRTSHTEQSDTGRISGILAIPDETVH